MLEMFSAQYYFNETSTTKSKIKETLCLFWDEKANDPDASNTAKKRAMALHNTVNFVIDSRPALSLINPNTKKVLSAQFSLVFNQLDTNSLSLFFIAIKDTER